MLVLVIDDEEQIRKLVKTGLEGYGYEVLTASAGDKGLTLTAQHNPDLVILDIFLGGDLDGIDVCRRIREWSQVPIIILSVRSDDREKVAALNLGADDYVTKPFNMEELHARMKAVLRRVSMGPETDTQARVSIGELEIDLANRRVKVAGEEVHFSPIEYDLLRILATNRGRILTHQALLAEVWGPEYREMTHYVRIQISHIRHKLRENPSGGVRYIHNEPGIGYRFTDADE